MTDTGTIFRRATPLVCVLAVLLALPAGGAAAQQRQVPQAREQVQLSFAPLVRSVAPAVVNVFSRKLAPARRSSLFDDPLLRRFFGDDFAPGGRTARMQSSLGSGVIVDTGGLVITNNHVIEDADEIIVALSDRREFEAEIVLADERTDLAVLRIGTGGEALPVLELMNSDDLEVGDLVLAIGNPFGVAQTVTSGIVSALARTQVGISDFQFFIQTDAAINPGNSGGALVTMDGRLAGVNTAIFSRSGGSIGIGFAIPANMAASVIAAAMKGSRVERPWLGAASETVTADIATSIGLAAPAGVLINGIYPDSPAERGGLRVGDLVLAVNGRDVNDPEGLGYRIAIGPIGETAVLEVRRDGEIRELRIGLAAAPENPPREVTDVRGGSPLAGARVANLSPALADELGLDTIAMAQGVIVLGIAPRSPANRIRLRPGDIVLRVNSQIIETVHGLKAALDDRSEWRIMVRRAGRDVTIAVRQ